MEYRSLLPFHKLPNTQYTCTQTHSPPLKKDDQNIPLAFFNHTSDMEHATAIDVLRIYSVNYYLSADQSHAKEILLTGTFGIVVTRLCARASSMNMVGTLSPSMSWFLGDIWSTGLCCLSTSCRTLSTPVLKLTVHR